MASGVSEGILRTEYEKLSITSGVRKKKKVEIAKKAFLFIFEKLYN